MTGKRLLAVAALLVSFSINAAPVSGVGGIPDPFPGDLPDPFPGSTPDPFPGYLPDPFPGGGAPDPLPGGAPDPLPGGAPDPFPGMTPEKPDFSGDSIWWLDRDGLLDFIDDLGNGDLYPGSTPFFDYLQGLDVPATLEEHIDFLTSNGGFVDRWRGEDIESTFSDSGIVIETATEATTIATVSATSYSLGASVVPIPAAAWLFGSALMGLGWMRRKRLG